MTETGPIFRKWSALIRTADEQEYVAYIARTGIDEAANTPGNLGHQIMVRTIGDGTSEVTATSWWRDMDAVRDYAGPTPEIALYYPEDDRFLLTRPETVEHHRIYAAQIAVDVTPDGLAEN